ncbi:MAG: hypothetical protein HFG49_06340 [Lachnospiraceae bacterium]|nr:hypothetical protein [Lachnospiraceae bacterium]
MGSKEQNREKYKIFRNTYPEFIYDRYETEETETELIITYHFQILGLSEFAPVWRFPKGKENRKLPKEMIVSLGMAELVSYWKLTCSPRVTVKAGYLNQEQITWWKRLYYHGLGEFFYINGIQEADRKSFMEIYACPLEESGYKADGSEWERNDSHDGMWVSQKELSENQPENTRLLVPIGGGKDSAVTLELLKEGGGDCFGYIINPRGATCHTAEAAGLPAEKVICAKRSLDQNMLELNRKGFLNGHTPFSAVVAFSSLIAAYLYRLGYIALSNESSANESTVLGSSVNHQYSKSFQFERDFHQYASRYLPGSSYYFSLLRPLSEFQIAGYFAECKHYHKIFRSCNAGSKEDIWCGHCPKCLFVYLILSPFLSQEEMKEIFGRDLLEDESLYQTLEQLTGIQEEKPFECVGSRSEVNTAITLVIRKMEEEKEELPKLLKKYQDSGLYETYSQIGDLYSGYFDEENLVPEFWKALVRNRCCRK